MEILNNVNWYINDNLLSTYLMRFHVNIHIHKSKSTEEVIFQVVVFDENMDKLKIYFTTLEETISFVQFISMNCLTLDDIVLSIGENYKGKKPKVKKRKESQFDDTNKGE